MRLIWYSSLVSLLNNKYNCVSMLRRRLHHVHLTCYLINVVHSCERPFPLYFGYIHVLLYSTLRITLYTSSAFVLKINQGWRRTTRRWAQVKPPRPHSLLYVSVSSPIAVFIRQGNCISPVRKENSLFSSPLSIKPINKVVPFRHTLLCTPTQRGSRRSHGRRGKGLLTT